MQKDNQNPKQAKRPICLKFRVSESEKALIAEKMAAARIINREAYIRKMVLDGYIIRVEYSQINKLLHLHSNVANNINQIARKANQTSSIHANEIAKIRDGLEAFYPQLRKAIAELCSTKF